MRRYFLIGLGCVLWAGLITGGAHAAAGTEGTGMRVVSSPTLQESAGKIDATVLRTLQKGGAARALIVLAEQADLSGADALTTKEAKGTFVYNALRAVADRTQAPILAELNRRGLSYRTYYVTNVVAVENLDANTATALAARADVGRIAANPDVKLQEPVSQRAAPNATPRGTRGIEWNIRKIGADKVWDKGFRGKGMVVANADTGVQWDHPALIKKYRGYNKKTGKADDSYNWWDAIHSSIAGGENPCGLNAPKPCDDFGHGTHTMGTLVGGTSEDKIGVAPGAKWIACHNMDQGVGRPSTYIECFQFFLAPWDKNGKNPDPLKAPDVVNNSWGCTLGAPPDGEGCTPDSLRQATRALRAAAIFLAMSAGNSGPECATVADPASLYNVSTTVGATNQNDQLAGFSSRGPVKADGSNRRKPDLSAPGESVRSSFPGNTYEILDGTSMAAPHVAGAVALLWQAKPSLRGSVTATEKLLFQSADPKVTFEDRSEQTCGGTSQNDIPNNLFGYGRLDVWKAFKQTR